jgi:hypothetical protein
MGEIDRLGRFYPVIHVTDMAQAIENTDIAFAYHASGVWLISHTGMEPSKLNEIYHAVCRRNPNEMIGINYLNRPNPMDALDDAPQGLRGLWVDNIENIPIPLQGSFNKRTKKHGIKCFGGVAFKYQHSYGTIAEQTKRAIGRADVITTSGDATGMPPSIQKIQLMHKALDGAAPLAIASGITPQNVKEYLPYCQDFLVATGISESFTQLDPALVKQMAGALR